VSDTFKCDVCKGEFPKAWTDEEAIAEAQANFGASVMDDAGTVCHDCFLKMQVVDSDLLNFAGDPGLLSDTTHHTGQAGGGKTWANKTPTEILADFEAALQACWDGAYGAGAVEAYQRRMAPVAKLAEQAQKEWLDITTGLPSYTDLAWWAGVSHIPIRYLTGGPDTMMMIPTRTYYRLRATVRFRVTGKRGKRRINSAFERARVLQNKGGRSWCR
jgi:hypothetical protein